MDEQRLLAEIKAYIDSAVEGFTVTIGSLIGTLDERMARLEQRMDRLEQRLNRLEQGLSAVEQNLTSLRVEMNDRFLAVDERFISIDERLRTMELRIDHFETRVMDRLASIETVVSQIATRTTNLENQLVDLNVRVDGLADDNRQRFRVLTERVAAIERLVA